MSVILKSLVSGSQLTTSAATYYTCPAATQARIDSASLTNTTTSSVTATFYLVPSGSSASASNTIISAKAIGAGQTYNCPELIGKVLQASGTIQGLSNTASALTLIASGVEVS